MPKYTLHYFNAQARAEITRYIFACAGVSYEDKRYTFEEWPKIKPTMKSGQVPQLEVDGEILTQSMAIARYLANEFGLAGKTPFEKARADMIVDIGSDFFTKVVLAYFEKDEEKKVEKKKKIVDETFPAFLTKLENLLKENNNGERYFVGLSLTWADLQVFQTIPIVQQFEIIPAVDLTEWPKLKAFMERIPNIPRMKEWLNNRPETEK